MLARGWRWSPSTRGRTGSDADDAYARGPRREARRSRSAVRSRERQAVRCQRASNAHPRRRPGRDGHRLPSPRRQAVPAPRRHRADRRTARGMPGPQRQPRARHAVAPSRRQPGVVMSSARSSSTARRSCSPPPPPPGWSPSSSTSSPRADSRRRADRRRRRHQVLAHLNSSPARDAIDWSRVDIFWGDERFVPADDPDRNEKQAQGRTARPRARSIRPGCTRWPRRTAHSVTTSMRPHPPTPTSSTTRRLSTW